MAARAPASKRGSKTHQEAGKSHSPIRRQFIGTKAFRSQNPQNYSSQNQAAKKVKPPSRIRWGFTKKTVKDPADSGRAAIPKEHK
jgi:hypothetical protein